MSQEDNVIFGQNENWGALLDEVTAVAENEAGLKTVNK